MKFLIVIVITILLLPNALAQCPSNEDTGIEIKDTGIEQEVIITFYSGYENIQEVKIIEFGGGVIEEATIRKINNGKYSILDLKSGEYMVQVIGKNCTSYVGTDKDYRGFMVK